MTLSVTSILSKVSRCSKGLFAELPVLTIGWTNIWNGVNYWDRQSHDTLWSFNRETFLERADTRKRQLLCESVPRTTKMGDFNFSYDGLCGQLLNTRTERENSPFITQVILLQPFQPSSPETLVLFRDGRVWWNDAKGNDSFSIPSSSPENDKWCSSIAKRQISAGATTVRWIDVLFMPPDGEAMGANDLYQEENPEYHRKSLCLALRWGITLCIKARTGRRTMSRIKVIYFSHLEFAEFRLLF